MSSRNKHPSNIYEVLRPLFAFSRMFGLTAFRFIGEPPYVQIKVTRNDLAALMMNFAANSFCVYLNVSYSRLSRMTGSAVMDRGMAFLFPFGACIMICLALDNFLRRNSTSEIIAELFMVDRSLRHKNHRIDHPRQYRTLQRILMMLFGFIITGTVFSLTMSLVSNFSFVNHAINAFSYLLTGVQLMIVNFHFLSGAQLVRYRLKEIKLCLENHLESRLWKIEKKPRWGRIIEPIDVIAELADDYSALAQVVEKVNRVYSNQIIALITGVGMFSIFVIYACSYSYYVGRVEEFRLSLILLATWIFYVIMVGLIFSSGMDVRNASKDIVYLLNEAVLNVDDLIIRRKLLCFSQQILLRKPILRSIFYEFNWKTLFSMFGFVVTYIVILMQFDETSEGSNNDAKIPILDASYDETRNIH